MEALSIEELIEELEKIGMRTHTSKDAIGDAKDMWSPAGEVKPAGIWYAMGGAWLRFLLTVNRHGAVVLFHIHDELT